MSRSSLEKWLFDYEEGSCRDINFLKPTWEGVCSLAAMFAENHRQFQATDSDGAKLTELSPAVLGRAVIDNGYVHAVFLNADEVLKDIQLWVSHETNCAPYIELTFFPEAVAESDNAENEFLSYIGKVSGCLGASRFYCRYENASWDFGDTGPYSGVVFVSGAT